LAGRVTIGEDNHIHSGVVIGDGAQAAAQRSATVTGRIKRRNPRAHKLRHETKPCHERDRRGAPAAHNTAQVGSTALRKR
jgi:hypothetical protein